MNILIKLMSIVALVIAPTLGNMFGTRAHHEAKAPVKTEVNVVSMK
jgi:hypothetical protein